MILIGQFDSPFVRRVGIALRLYGQAFEHRPWSAFGDGERIAAYNPLRRVPTLLRDDGEVLIEVSAILDHLDEAAGPERALVPAAGESRRAVLKVAALAAGLSDKLVSLFYERLLHAPVSPAWVARCEAQIAATLDALEADRAARPAPFWFAGRLTHADIAVGCALRFLAEAHPAIGRAAWPALAAHAEFCEAQEPFRSVYQPFIPPAG